MATITFRGYTPADAENGTLSGYWSIAGLTEKAAMATPAYTLPYQGYGPFTADNMVRTVGQRVYIVYDPRNVAYTFA